MSDFSLDIDEIKDEVKNRFEQEEKILQESSLKTKAKTNTDAIFQSNLYNPKEREKIVQPLDNFGLSEMNQSTETNKLLSTRIMDISKGGDEANNIGEKLVELNSQLRDLDPKQVNFGKKSFLGRIQDPVKKYFSKYQKAEKNIDDIIKSLDHSSQVLENDNITLLQEETSLREITDSLLADIELGKMMDDNIEAEIADAKLKGIEEDKIKIVEEEILFPLRQRIMDLEQMIVVNQQGIISLNVIRKNNKELIRGVNRTKNVTLSALRTGVMVASALYDQKVVINKINAINNTTSDIITSTSHILHEQGNEIQKSSSETMISPEVLQDAFNEAIAAVEDVSTYKQEALPKMKETINLFSQMAIEGQKVVNKIETAENTNNKIKTNHQKYIE